MVVSDAVHQEARRRATPVPGTPRAVRATLPFLLGAVVVVAGCANVQWDSKSQILLSESSQVKVRSVQTRVFDTTDKVRALNSVLNVMQDLFFQVDVLDHELGVVSGKKLYESGSSWKDAPSYYRYETDALLLFSSGYRTFGPFEYRSDLTRLTVTVRPRGETQILVRASLQYDMNVVDDPAAYQTLFKLFRQSIFLASKDG